MPGNWDPDLPYHDLPDLPPAVDLESKEVLKVLVEAKSSLAALNEACRLVPNPTVLINVLPILEAQSSSEIENIVTTTDELFRYSNIEDDGDSTSTKETLRYRTALHAGYKSLVDRPLGITTAIEVCSNIHDREMSIRNLPGTKIANPSNGKIIYTPPDHPDVIKSKLANWEKFLHNTTELDPLVRMAVAHYQFEAIHPFFDGNGRTGRVINILALVEFGLLEIPVLYLSRYVLDNKSDYYRLLNEVTVNGAWTSWVVFMLNAVAETSEWTLNRMREIRDLQAALGDEIKTKLPSVYRHELIEVIFEQPYCRIDNVMNKSNVTRQTASTWLGSLAEAGILTTTTVGRTKLFINHRFFQLLTRR